MILDLKDGKLSDSGKQEEGKTFHNLHVLGMNDDLWDEVCGLGSETWKNVVKIFVAKSMNVDECAKMFYAGKQMPYRLT